MNCFLSTHGTSRADYCDIPLQTLPHSPRFPLSRGSCHINKLARPYTLYGESNFRIDRASITCTLAIKTPVSNVFRVDFCGISRGEHGDRAGLGTTADNAGFTEYIARPRARTNRLCANGIETAEGCDTVIPLRKITQHESKKRGNANELRRTGMCCHL